MRLPPQTRRRLGLWVLIAAALLTFGDTDSAAEASSTRASAARSAHLWIDRDGGSCVRRPAKGAYTDALACDSLQEAANAAGPGDLVLIRDGRYQGQQLIGSKRLTFAAAGPGRPSFGQIIISASNVTFRHLLVENRDAPTWTICPYFDFTLFTCGANQTYVDVIVDGLNRGWGDQARRGGLQVEDTSVNLVFRNGEIRGIADAKGFQGGADGMQIEDTRFHDIRLTPAGGDAGVHNECAYITGGDNQVWRRNQFLFCPVMAMFFPNYNGGPPFTGVTIENNLFTHTLDSNGSWHGSSPFVIPNGANGQNQVTNWVIRYNTFEVSPNFGSTPGRGDDNGSARFYGNLGADGACGVPEWTYSYNVGETCGGAGEVAVRPATNNRTGPNQAPFYVDAPAGDFRLRPGARGINRGDPARFPRTDADGSNRPIRSAPDAGAFEYGTGVLLVGGLDAGPTTQRRVADALRAFEGKNAADLLVTLGNNDPTRRRSFAASWRASFGWLGARGIGVAGTLGSHDGRYQFATLGMPSAHYVLRLRDIEVVVLDSSAVNSAQTGWLRATLARPTPLFRVVVLHRPPFSCSTSSGSAAVRKHWVPLFQRYGVRLVVSHEQTYQRFVSGKVTYVVGGSVAPASAPRACPRSFPRRRVARARPGFVYLTVDSTGATVRAVDLNAKTIDSFRVR